MLGRSRAGTLMQIKLTALKQDEEGKPEREGQLEGAQGTEGRSVEFQYTLQDNRKREL